MANFDLISEDDFFSEEKKAKTEKPLPEKPQPEEDLSTQPEQEDILSADELTEEPDITFPEESTDPAKDFNEDPNDSFDTSDAFSKEPDQDDPIPALTPTQEQEE